jgi:hypothetical protein
VYVIQVLNEIIGPWILQNPQMGRDPCSQRLPSLLPNCNSCVPHSSGDFGKQELIPGRYYVSGYVDDAFDVVVENRFLQSCGVRRVPLYNCVSFREQCGDIMARSFELLRTKTVTTCLWATRAARQRLPRFPVAPRRRTRMVVRCLDELMLQRKSSAL